MRVAEDEETLCREAKVLAGLVARHVHLEEQEAWPYVHRRRSRIGAALVGAQFALARRTAPTRPHPRGPDRPAGILTTGMAASTLDRVRDKLSGRRSRYPARSDARSYPDPIHILTAQHNRMRSLMRHFEDGGLPDPGVVDDLVRAWAAHDSMEREHLYPLLRTRIHDGNGLYSQWLSDHGELTSELVEIERHPREPEYRRERLGELIPHLLVHMDQEEEGVLPAMRARLADEELADLGLALSQAEDRAPTHPHPVLAGAGAGAKLARLVVRPVDTLRDRLHGRQGGDRGREGRVA
jgi:hemerythrin-like domain-containing protein